MSHGSELGGPGLKRNLDPFVSAVRERAQGLRSDRDLERLIEEIGDQRIVMLGEASHGTHEFYAWRRKISEILISKHGYSFIAVEGDWPACWNLNQFIRGKSETKIREVMKSFARWPTWMWANMDIVGLAEWMRSHQAGFFGLDVYSLFESVDAVIRQLERVNPFLAKRARLRYACFDPFHRDERAYARSLIGSPDGCEFEVHDMLEDLLRARVAAASEDEEAFFDAEQNARVIANAENYYRTMVHADDDSWNVRDRHMLDTLEILLDRHGRDSKAIVWAHNTHIGDYRATDMVRLGQINLGGLAREKWGEENVALVGFGTYEGEVTASHAWDGPIETMRVPPSPTGSMEAAFHEVSRARGEDAFWVALRDERARGGALAEMKGHRAIGVVYRPEYERHGNYVPTSLANRYDAFVFVDRTTALEPLAQPFAREQIPETWPNGV